MIKTETEIIVPDVITIKGDAAERKIRLEDCHNQNEVMDFLKICLSLYYVNYPENSKENFGHSTKKLTNNHKKYGNILDTVNTSSKHIIIA